MELTDPESRDRHEAPGERLDRQWNELLQELRVAQTGIQLLGAFLLVLPFQARFDDITGSLHMVYLAAVACATLSIFCVVAPVVAHRMLFQRHRKDVLVLMGHWLAKAGLVLLGITVALGTTLVFGVVMGQRAALVVGIASALVCLGLWWVLPVAVGLRAPEEEFYSAPERGGSP